MPLYLEHLLTGIEDRGPIATGLAWWDLVEDPNHHADGKYWPFLINDAVTASEFVKTYPNAVERAALSGTTIGHTRFPTVGDPSIAGNNHPIRYGQITLVHNGCIDNDNWLFHRHNMTRYADVDSEIIPAMINFHIENTDPHSDVRMKQIAEALEQIEGSMAIAFFIDDEPHTLYLAKGFSSPLVTAVTENGTTVFASTKTALKEGMDPFGKADDLYENMVEHNTGTILRIDQSGKVETAKFTADPGLSRSWRSGMYWKDDFHYSSSSITPKKQVSDDTLEPDIAQMLENRRVLVPDTLRTAPDWADDTFGPDLLDAPTTLAEVLQFFSVEDVLGMFPYWEQDLAMRRMAEDFFHYPPTLANKARVKYVSQVIDGAIEYVITWLYNDKDKRKWDDIAAFLRRSKFHLRPGDKVRVTVRGDAVKREGWVVSCPNEFPTGFYVLAVNITGEVVLVRRQYHGFDAEAPSEEMIAALMDHALLVAQEQDKNVDDREIVLPLHLWPEE